MKRDVIATLPDASERTLRVLGAASGDRLEVLLDGQSVVVDAKQVAPGTFSLIFGSGPLQHRSLLVSLEPRKRGTYATVGAGAGLVTVEDALRRQLRAATAKSKGADRGERILAPIAGKVVKCLVEVGQLVAPGHAVMVLEAMKMENELVAERGGTVVAVAKAVGQAVDTGELLIELS